MAADTLADAVAIIGLSCRLPGAPDFESLGVMLAEGREGISWLSRSEQEAAGVPTRLLDDPRLVPAAALLDGVTDFDVGYFRMPIGEAMVLDPQHRLMLELGREALDDAGYPPGSVKEQTGIYVGTEVSNYFLNYLLPKLDGPVDPLWTSQIYLNDKDSLAAQMAYRLGLAGPCSVVQGVCATGLLVLHEGVKSLLGGECELALVGAAALRLPQHSGYIHQRGGPLSADGHTRSFDARGTGTVYGSGGAVLVLRRYEEALRRGDRVHALIRGSAVYTDGAARSSFGVPTAKGYVQVLAESLAVASLSPADVQYIEGVGTATPLGDALELSGIAQVYKGHRLHVGSLHSNIGHLQAASGLAGLLKVVWMLREGVIPATLHFETPNEALAGQLLTVNREPVPWPSCAGARRAGVNALGTGGIYGHALLEQAPRQGGRVVSRPAARWQRVRCWPQEPRRGQTAGVEALLHGIREALPLGTAAVSSSTSLSALGLSSLEMLALLSKIEREHPRMAQKLLGVRWETLTISALAQLLQEAESGPELAPALLQEDATATSTRSLGSGTAAYEERVLRVDGRDTHVLLAGTGAPLLLLPPLGATAAAWLPALPHLSQGFRVIAPSLPGLGKSVMLPEDRTPSAGSLEERIVKHLVLMLDELGHRQPVHLVGWSYGGCVALRFALSQPQRVASLVLACSTGRPLKTPSFAWLQALLAVLTASIETELASVVDEDRAALSAVFSAPKVSHPGTMAQAQALASFHVLAELGAMAAPTLVVCGDQDQVLPLSHGQELQRRIPRSELVILPEAGHLLPATHAVAFVALLNGFMKSTGETSC